MSDNQLCGLGAIQNPHTDRQGFKRPALSFGISHPLRQIKDLQTHVDLLIKSNQELIESLENEKVKYDAYRILRSAVCYLRKSRPPSVWDPAINTIMKACEDLKREYLKETVDGVTSLLDKYKNVSHTYDKGLL